MKQSLAYYILLVGAFLWCAFLFVPPFLSISGGFPVLSETWYSAYSRICHQYDSHSLHILGEKLGVCARCSCIYFGFFVGVLLAPMVARDKFFSQKRVFLISIMPMVIDVSLDMFGISESTILTRTLTGSFFGLISALHLTPLFIHGVNELFTKLFHNARNLYESQTR